MKPLPPKNTAVGITGSPTVPESKSERKSKEVADHGNVSVADAPSPFELAQIAVLLASKNNSNSPCDFLSEAREVLRRSASYLREQNAKTLKDFMHLSGISFETILASNDKNYPDEKKLLPGITTGEGLKKLIRRYYKSHAIRLTKQEQRAIKPNKTSQKLTEIQDQTGEGFISGEYLPPDILSQIQEWRDAQRSANSRKPKRLPKSVKTNFR